MNNHIIKTTKGFERDDGSARYIYDAQGHYLGQYQSDALSEEPDAGEIYLKTYQGDPCFHQLTAAEMVVCSRMQNVLDA